MTVTATISTKDRYFTTLPLAIQAICTQTVTPNKFVLFDDGEHRDLRGVSPYTHLFRLLDTKKIGWEVVFGNRTGQVTNHQLALDRADTDFIWRLDDDNVPEPTCLEHLLGVMRDQPTCGAVGGLVIDPSSVGPRPSFLTSKIEDILCPFNLQWYDWRGAPEIVDHLYSTFLYRVEAGRKAGGYCRELSPVGHREETMFSHAIQRAGYKLVVEPQARTWHMREGSGGIRSYNDGSLWAHDEAVFLRKLGEWGVKLTEFKFVVLDNGIGDHIVFKSILPKILAKNSGARTVVACCYPEVFKGVDGITLVSIADAKAAFKNLDQWNVYKWCAERDWKRPLAEAFEGMYL